MAKRGRKNTELVDGKQGSCADKSTLGQEKSGKIIMGAGGARKIKMIPTKLVSFFASKSEPDIDAETLRAHLEDKMGISVSGTRKLSSLNLLSVIL